jgi:hypothetical protein
VRVSNFSTSASYIIHMQKNVLTNVLWHSLGGVLGVSLLVGVAFALNRFFSYAGITLG